MSRYRDGDLAAFEALYERHKGPLYRYLLRHCGSPETAADLFQEVWSRIIQARQRYRAVAKFTTYLYHVAHNCFIDHCRRQGRRPRIDPEAAAAEFEDRSIMRPETAAQVAESGAALRAALGRLPDEQREVFLLHAESGLTLEEIGRVTGVGKETAKSRLRYAVAKLRQALPAPTAALTGTEQ